MLIKSDKNVETLQIKNQQLTLQQNSMGKICFSLAALLLLIVVVLPAQPKQPTFCPPGYYNNNNQCIHCSTLNHTKINKYSEPNTCPCEKDYTWSKTFSQCIPTDKQPLLILEDKQSSIRMPNRQNYQNIINKIAGICSESDGFILKNNICLNCKTIANTTGTVGQDSSCICDAGYTWWPQYQICMCWSITLNNQAQLSYLNSKYCRPCQFILNQTESKFCSSCKGGIFGMSRIGCHNCSTIQFTIGAKKNHSQYGNLYGECVCRIGYQFNNNIGQCVCSSNYYANGTSCLDCSKLTTSLISKCKSCSNPFVFDQYLSTCKMGANISNFNLTSYSCNLGYDFKINPNDKAIAGCACSYSKGYILNGNLCVTCQSLSSSYPNLCQNCDNSKGFHLGIVQCIYCSLVKNGLATATIDGCACKPNYFWNQISAQCQCDLTLGFIPQTDGSCYDCKQIAGTLLPAYKTTCKCTRGYFYNSATKKCQCDTKGGNAFTLSGKCINCAGMIGSNEQAKLKTCVCLGNYAWNALTTSCECNTKLSNIGYYNGICLNCQTVKNSNGFSMQLGCACKNGFIWNNLQLNCTCPPGYYMNGIICSKCESSNYNCQICSSYYYALNEGVCYDCYTVKNFYLPYTYYGSLCYCNQYYVWIPSLNACVCNYNDNYGLTLFADKQDICLMNDVYQNSIIFKIICNQTFGYSLIKINGYSICLMCSSVPNSAKTANGTQCGCLPGYQWSTEVYPFSCICSISNGSFKNGSFCSPCSSLPLVGIYTKSGCLSCNSSQGFLKSKDNCIICSSLPNTDGTATVKGCGCKKGVWDPKNLSCVNDDCPPNNIYNVFTNKCQCNWRISILVNGICIRCDSYSNSNGVNNDTSCRCNNSYVWQSFNNSKEACICLDCNKTATSFLIGKINGAQIYFQCSTVNYALGVNQNSQQCLCPQNLIWSWNPLTVTGLCICNDPLKIISNDGSCICDGNYSFPNGEMCIDCRSVNGSVGILNQYSLECKCIINSYWNNNQKTCTCFQPYIINVINQQCQCRGDLISDGNGNCICDKKTSILLSDDTCFSCKNVISSTGFVSQTKQNTCQCVSNFIFAITDNVGYCNCGNYMSLYQGKCRCLGQNCGNYQCDWQNGNFININNNGECMHCSIIEQFNGTAYYYTQCYRRQFFNPYLSFSSQCPTYNYYLNGVGKCQPCTILSTVQEYNECVGIYIRNFEGNFGITNLGTIKCSTVSHTVPGKIMDRLCVCQKGYYFNYWLAVCECDFSKGFYSNGTNCLECRKAGPLFKNNCFACLPPFFFDNTICYAPNYLEHFDNTSQHAKCLTGFDFKINFITNKIISCACSAVQRYYFDGTTCSPCASINQQSQKILIQYCQGCNNDYGFHRGLVECFYCKYIKGSTGQATKEGCTCHSQYYWNLMTGKCECDQNRGYFSFQSGCFSCNMQLHAQLPALSNSCKCKRGYNWNPSTMNCECDISGGYFDDLSKCATCLTIFNTANKQKINNTCTCKYNSDWDYTTQTCYCNYLQGYAESQQGCVYCRYGRASIFGCQCPKGFLWSKIYISCICGLGFYRYGDICKKCSDSLPDGVTLQGCNSCSISQRFNQQINICYYCPSLGEDSKWVSANKTSQNNQCQCVDNIKYMWNGYGGRCICNYNNYYYSAYTPTGEYYCAFCQPNSCDNCIHQFYNWRTQRCTKCQDLDVTVDTFDTTYYRYPNYCSDNCPTGYQNAYYYGVYCVCSKNQGYYLNQSSCINCNMFQNTTIKNYCIYCDNNGGFVYNSNGRSCILCSTKANSDGTASSSGCGCVQGMIWEAAVNQCVNEVYCQSPMAYNIEINKCACNPRISVSNFADGCTICSSLNKTTGRIITDPVSNQLVCQCSKGYIFGLNTNQQADCICQYPLIYSQEQGNCVCNPEISLKSGQLQCFSCSELGQLGTTWVDENNPNACQCQPGLQFYWNITTKVGSCICSKGFKFDVQTKSCICDLWLSIQVDGNCHPCWLIPFSNNITNEAGISCRCISPFEWKGEYSNCSCNTSSISSRGQSNTCILCSSFPFTVSKLDQNSCFCNQNLKWNQQEFYCQCNDDSAMLITGKQYVCAHCYEIANAIRKFNRTSCLCQPSFLWSRGKCSCPNNSFSVTVDNSVQCIKCDVYLYAKDVSILRTSCICINSLFVWNATLRTCVCSGKNSVAYRNGNTAMCVTCNSGVNAKIKISPTECSCLNQTYIWSPQLGICSCSDSSAVLANGAKCIQCDSSINALSKFNATSCICQPSILVWEIQGYCDCGPNAAITIDIDSIKCVTCNISSRAISKFNSTSCKCSVGFIWNGSTCICPKGFIYTNSMSCYDCKNDRQLTFDPYLCLCSSPKIWDDLKKLCVSCGTSAVPKSTSTAYEGIACGCIKGYVWDVMSNSCILKCTSTPQNCMNCKKILNSVIIKNATIGNPSNYRNLPGGQNMARIYKSVYSNYESLSNYACTCATGYSWDDYRKRCYNTLTIFA